MTTPPAHSDQGEELRDLVRNGLRWGCHGIVHHDGEMDACGKPVTVIIDGRGTEAETFWPACTYHGHRWGGERIVPLTDIAAALAPTTADPS